MDEKLIGYISGFSISIAAIAGCIRYKRVDPVYHPFLWLAVLAFINEITSFVVSRQGYSNAVNSNIYSLFESFMIIFLFKRLGLFERRQRLFPAFLALFVCIWLIDNFMISGIGQFNSFFDIIVSFSIVMMSIGMINRLLVARVKILLRDAAFLICMGFVLFFTYAMLVEIFWTYGLNSGAQFRSNVYMILTYINLATNLIYALAILWMPTKCKYILK